MVKAMNAHIVLAGEDSDMNFMEDGCRLKLLNGTKTAEDCIKNTQYSFSISMEMKLIRKKAIEKILVTIYPFFVLLNLNLKSNKEEGPPSSVRRHQTKIKIGIHQL